MRLLDLATESFRSLAGSRTRTLLTMLGITVGTTALTLILSLSFGLEKVIDDLVASDAQLRHVIVMPGFGRTDPKTRTGPGGSALRAAPEVSGEMSDLKRQRLQRALLKRSRGGPPFQMRSRVIDAETERSLAALSGVAETRLATARPLKVPPGGLITGAAV